MIRVLDTYHADIAAEVKNVEVYALFLRRAKDGKSYLCVMLALRFIRKLHCDYISGVGITVLKNQSSNF